MRTVTSIDPVTRLEGHLKIEITVDTVNGQQQVVDARATGTLFRGFESILLQRVPENAPDITQRICGVCPVSHGMASVIALDKASGITVPNNARVMRNLVLGSNFVQSHILHFYHLAIQDFVDGPNMPPWQPSWKIDKRFSAGQTSTLVNHYLTALDMRRKAHEMGALFGGKLPHPPAFVPGGFTTTPRSTRISKFKTYLNEITSFIRNVYIADAQLLSSVYSDYLALGKGHRNLLAYGVFDLDSTGNNKLMRNGYAANGSMTISNLNPSLIAEQVRYSWYADSTKNLKPSAGSTVPQYPKSGAYSWLKAPRYDAQPYEAGPLARMWVNGDYRNGISVMDRHLARAQEAAKIADAMLNWVNELQPAGAVFQAYTKPLNATAYGLTEAPRGALGHWLSISNGLLSRYQIVTPTCWNASPRDAAGGRGPLEQSLIGTPVQDTNQPMEVLRVIHSFDPCLSCAVHVMRPRENAKVFTLGHYHGEEEITTHDHPHTHDHDHPQNHDCPHA